MKARKILVSLAALALVAAISIGGTLAYLTSTDKVENTFTVGKIGMTMDEALVNEDGKPVKRSEDGTTLTEVGNPGEATRVNENSYKIMPGHTYTKDPTIYVAAKSEASYVFIAVKNEVAKYEAATASGGYTQINDQIMANGWIAATDITAPTGYTIYYKTQAATGNTAETLPIFSNFKIADNAESVDGYANFNGNVNIFAFAVQQDGFTGYANAWAEAGFGAKLNTLIG